MYRIAGLGTALLAATLVACAGPVAVPAPTASNSAGQAACAALDSALPSSVLTAVRRKTEPESPLTAAWGDPPITLQCGVAKPESLTATSALISVDGVDWLPEERSAGYLFTTIGLVANVELAVPDAYSPETGVLTDLAPAIKANIPSAKA